MQDLILDQIRGQCLTEIIEYPEEVLDLKFVTGILRCYHEQECCESFSYLGKESNKLGIVKDIIIETAAYLDKKAWKRLQKFSKDVDLSYYVGLDENSYDSYTVTTLQLSFVDNTRNIFKFLGASNGYYSESVHFEWKEIEENA